MGGRSSWLLVHRFTVFLALSSAYRDVTDISAICLFGQGRCRQEPGGEEVFCKPVVVPVTLPEC
ncbi:hypothetical protein E2C01_045883 [Portunus trituberculatus]|uniref:Secreted protein n=1 Tax=Portunus trituberculatus TaxID=210409 RepID=A0A5B7G661_PORTR|nr:hypothetical protein [Portunus trituberculatus]